MMVAWMSGLVIGLQNRARRFESASDLKKGSVKFLTLPFFIESVGLIKKALTVMKSTVNNEW